MLYQIRDMKTDNTKQAISDLLALSLKVEKTTSMKVEQITRMKAGKIRVILTEKNNESKRRKSGVKLEN